MKNSIAILFSFLFSLGVSAQVFQNATPLKPRTFSVGISPEIKSSNFGINIDGRAGLGKDMDIGLRAGVGLGDPYFGVDLKWLIVGRFPIISASTGLHVYGDPGLDGTLNITFPLNPSAYLYTGLDADLIFSKDIYMSIWIPVGLEVSVKKQLTVILEPGIEITKYKGHYLTGGVRFYF